MDELINKYSEILQKVYDDQTAGDYTFVGILSTMLRELFPVEEETCALEARR